MLKLIVLILTITYCAGLITGGNEVMNVNSFLSNQSNASVLTAAYNSANK